MDEVQELYSDDNCAAAFERTISCHTHEWKSEAGPGTPVVCGVCGITQVSLVDEFELELARVRALQPPLEAG